MSLQGLMYLHDSSSEGLVLLVHGCSGVNNLLSESPLQLLEFFANGWSPPSQVNVNRL